MIQFFHVSKSYRPSYRALADISLEITDGEFVFLTGPSGAGKSTLLKLLFREEEPTEGQILLDGKNIARLSNRGVAQLRRHIGLIFSEFKLLSDSTVLDNVALAAEVSGMSKKESRAQANQRLCELGLSERSARLPFTLSGGEQQRVAIARALIHNPRLVLADEPTENLDSSEAQQTMRLLFNARDKGATVIVSTHDVNIINQYGARVVLLQRGAVADDLKLASWREPAR